MIKIAPSILAADPIYLERDVRRAVEAGCDWIHVDVMDACFVPNLAYTPETVKRLHQAFPSIPLDVHLMMEHPETLLYAFLDAGAYSLTVHAEIDGDVPSLLRKIREHGARPGVALKPETPLNIIREYQQEADLILTMTVEPGFGGQKLDERVLEKMKALRINGYQGLIEADGGLTEENLPRLISCGLNIAVMGTSLFRAEDMKDTIRRIREMNLKG